MVGFCVKRYCDNDGGYPMHYCSLISPNLSESESFELPFGEDELVDGGSCGDVLYFFDLKGKTVIFKNLKVDKSKIEISPPKALTPIDWGWYLSCGVCYDTKSEEYKVIRIYTQIDVNEADEVVCKYYFDLYSVKSGSAKYITEPTRKCCVKLGTSIYVGEAGSGSGSCYWVARLTGDASSDDPLMNHVLSFDFATESFDQFPLPPTANDNSPLFELVECRGSLGALVYWIPLDEFSLEPHQFSSDLYIQLFVRNGKGTSWDLLYYVSIADAYRPLGLRDHLLFLAPRPSGDGCSPLIVYNLASKTLKKLDVYNCSNCMSGFSYGDKGRKKKKKKKKKKKTKKKEGEGRGRGRGRGSESSQKH